MLSLYLNIQYRLKVAVRQNRPHFLLTTIVKYSKMVQECTPDVVSCSLYANCSVSVHCKKKSIINQLGTHGACFVDTKITLFPPASVCLSIWSFTPCRVH